MTILFSDLNFMQKFILILEIAVLLSGVVYLLFRMISNKRVSLNVTKGQLSYAPDSKDPDTIKTVATGVFFQTLEAVAMMTQIKTKLILHDQMTYLEERLVIVKDTILEAYRQSWKEAFSSGSAESGSQEYLFYQSLVELMKEDMKSSIRVFFLRNHFSSYDDHQLTSYIEEKNELLMVKAYQFLRDMYPVDKMVVSFDSIVKGLDKVKPDLEHCLLTVFKKAVDITRERHQQITDLETGLRNKVKISYGVDLSESGVEVFMGALKKNDSGGR